MSTRFIRALRAVSLIEGVSYLLLLGVAMPMDRLGGMRWAVEYTGLTHGLLFILLWLMVAAAWAKGLPTKLSLIVMVASILPAGPFFVDHKLKAVEAGNSTAPTTTA